MKILFINFEYPPVGGGGGVANKILIDELVKKHQITLITSSFQGLPNKEKIGNLNILRVPIAFRRSASVSTFASLFSFPLSGAILGIGILKKEKFDLIHSVSAIPSAVTGLIFAKIASLPHVLTVIGGDVYDPTRLLSPNRNIVIRWIVTSVIRFSDAVISPSSELAGRMRSLFGSRGIGKKIEVIPWGFKKPKYVLRKKKIKNDDCFKLITLTRLVKRKGLEHLLMAVSLLSEEKLKLIIAGEGPEKENLKKLAKKLKINKKVEFKGFVSEHKKYKLLSSSDCFILPTLHEAFGLVFQEAMYCGLPIITTNVGGQTDFLTDGINGFLVPVENARALKEKIQILIRDPKLRDNFSEKNRERINDFLISQVTGKYEDIYFNLCK